MQLGVPDPAAERPQDSGTPESAAVTVVEMQQYQDTLDALGAETSCLLGHTGLPTKGSRWNNDKNHPLVGSYTIGVHNGIIFNGDQLFASLHLPRQAEVDRDPGPGAGYY